MELTLPILEKIVWQKVGNKNSIRQLLDNAVQSDFEFISSHRGYAVIASNGIKYYLTINAQYAPENADYVLKVNKKATEERLRNNEIIFKEWIKHPKLINHTCQDVLASWKGKFNFVEETENSNGLREPQIAGLYSILSHLKVGNNIGTVVMPTGTGKTETMLATLTAHICQKLLITVPSDALRTQIGNKF